MNDDFAGDVTTEGRYEVNANPLLVSSDFLGDSDWFLVSGLRKFYDYKVTVFLPPDGFTPIAGQVNVSIYDADSNSLHSTTQPFRTQHEYTHVQNSGQRFLGITTQTTGHYRSQVLEADITGDTVSTSRVFQPNFGQRHAGSVTTTDDVDMFRIFLRAGKNYQFDLLGSASNGAQGSTLGNPKLQISNRIQVLAEDDDSGEGSNARIFFEPEFSAVYYLSVSGQGTVGSYLLGSPNLDDYLNSTATQGQLQINQTTTGRSDWDGDKDWFRFNMDAGFTYDFFGGNFSSPELYDRNGQLLVRSGNRYQSPVAQEVFVSVRGTYFGSSIVDYNIRPRYQDDNPATTFGDARLLDFGSTIGAIEDNEDYDLYRLDLEDYAFYDLKLDPFGNRQLSDARFTTYDSNGNILQTYDGGSTVQLRAFGQDTDPAFVLVDSPGDNTGAWTLNHAIRDRAAGDTSTGWNVQFIAGRGFVRNSIDFDGDDDYHRAALRADTWYEIDRGTFNADYSIRRPGGTEVDFNQMVSNGDKSYFYATQTGDHYLVVRDPTSDVPKPRGYTMSIRQNAAYQSVSLFEASEWVLAPRVSNAFRGLPLEVFSEVPLQMGDLAISANTLTRVTSDQWAEFSVDDSIDQSGDVFVRGIFRNGLKQDWSKVAIAHVELTPEIVPDDYVNDYENSFVFDYSDTLPAEYADDPMFASFEALSPEERTNFNFAVFGWSRTAGVSLRSSSSNIDMNVFKADLGPDQPAVLSFAPGEGRGHDVIINANSNANSNALDRSPKSTYQLLQAIGTGIGMQTSDSVSRLTSVMGTMVEPGLEDVYPTTPLLADRVMSFQSSIGTPRQTTNPIQFLQLNGDVPLAQGVFTTSRNGTDRYTISATGSADSVIIDLQGGAKSEVLGDVYRVIENGPDAILYDGFGGFGDDSISGNNGDNRLAGYGGKDVLRGGSGNDRLEGGRGDDFYDFGPASHQDVIREASPTAGGGSLPSGGLDTIRIYGRYDYNSIEEDITFSRLGNDLLIRLELDGRFNVNGDGIRVTNMHDPEQRVESLALFTDGQFVEQVSLVSVFEQAVASRGRFELLSTNDGFGSIASPV